MLKLCGDTEEKLAQELIVFELQMERDVVDPLYVLAEVNLSLSQHYMKPNINIYFSVFQELCSVLSVTMEFEIFLLETRKKGKKLHI